MYVDNNSLLFEDLTEEDANTLRDIEKSISVGKIPWDHPFIQKWFDAFGVETHRLVVGSTVLHIRVLQSIIRYYGWTK